MQFLKFGCVLHVSLITRGNNSLLSKHSISNSEALMTENLAGKIWNHLIVNKLSFTLRQQGTLHHLVGTVITICIILLIWAFVLYHVIGS